MCGIAGLVGRFPADKARSALAAMLRAQAHRGPDDEGLCLLPIGQGVVGLGNRRLAIVDLSPSGHQPMADPASGSTLVYNGETYNAPELRQALEGLGHRFTGRSDTEVLLRAYGQWQRDSIKKLKGMFALALWDNRRGRLLLARDHLGIKPLYYAAIPKTGIVFASEVRALLASGLVPYGVSRQAVAGYLAYGAVQEPLTIVEGVRALPPASWIEVDAAGAVVAGGRYWEMPRPEHRGSRSEDPRALIEEGKDVLKRAVQRHLLGDVPTGAFLSSGLDSTAVVGFCRQTASDRMQAFTVTFPDDPSYDEGHIARDTATRLGVIHHECPVSATTSTKWALEGLACMDQPSMDGINTYIVSKAVREQGIVVALSGQGSDEIFGGYRSFREVPAWLRTLRWARLVPSGWRAALARAAPLGDNRVRKDKIVDIARAGPDLAALYLQYRRLHSTRVMALFGLQSRELGLNAAFLDPSLDPGVMAVPDDPIATVSRLEIAYYLGNTLLRDGDVFGMANSLEIRVPFLDKDVVEWALRLPGETLLPAGMPSKYLLRQIASEFYGEAQARQSKRGFTLPFAQWLQGPLRSLVDDSLASLKQSGLVDPSGIDQVYGTFQREPRSAAWSRVWALVVLGHWIDRKAALSTAPATRDRRSETQTRAR